MDTRTAQALIRFGLGRRGEEPLPPDPAAWLLDQLRQPDPTRLDPRPSTATGLEALEFDRRNKPPQGQKAVPPLFRTQSRAELANALATPAPFRERLVWFWTNHFTVSIRGGCAASPSPTRASRRRLCATGIRSACAACAFICSR